MNERQSATNLLMLLFVAVAVAILLAPGATASDADIKAAVRSGFAEVTVDYNNMSSCRGCSSTGTITSDACLRWMKALNKTVSFTNKAGRGRTAAFEAFRNYGYAAGSYSESYRDAELNLPQESSDAYTLSQAQLATARRYAIQAARLLGLTRYP